MKRLNNEKQIESEVFTQAVSEMRSLIEQEVKEIRRISGIAPSPDSSQSQTTMSVSSQEDKLNDSLDEEEFRQCVKDMSLGLNSSPTGATERWMDAEVPLLSSLPNPSSGSRGTPTNQASRSSPSTRPTGGLEINGLTKQKVRS